MRRRTYKRGPSLEYEKKRVARLAEIEASKVPQEVPLFRGFLPANGFVTSCGAKGMKLDSMWSKYIVESYVNDDLELAAIALESCLADVSLVVEGGEYGCPMSIGGYGFYTNDMFENQANLLYKTERRYCTGIFLSVDEWAGIDKKLRDIAEYGYSKLQYACRGDTFTNLAVRDNAFKVAKLFLDKGVDPLITNANGDDLIQIVKQQYGALSLRLSDLQREKEASSECVLLPTEEKDLQEREQKGVEAIAHMLEFIGSLRGNIVARAAVVEKDKWAMKQAQLRRQPVPPEIAWSCAQEEKVGTYVVELEGIAEYITEKLRRFKEAAEKHVSLSTLMMLQQKNIKAKRKRVREIADRKAQEEEAAIKHRLALLTGEAQEEEIDSPFGLESSFNAIALLEQEQTSAEDPDGITEAEKELLRKHKSVLSNLHRNRSALSRDELARRHGGGDSDSDNETSYEKVGDSFHQVRKPKGGRRKDDALPTLGILRQSELEVVHYR
jgi:hypothetical protein